MLICHLLNANFNGNHCRTAKLEQANVRDKGERVNSTVIAQNSDAGIRNSLAIPRFALNFPDIEDSIRKFGVDDTLSIEVCLEEFEDTAQLMQWDELLKYIFANRSLKELAFTSYERDAQAGII